MGLFDAASLPSGPTSQGTTNSSVASWAQPYINQYLTGAQNLVNQGGQPNSLMQQSYTGAANLQAPGQFGQATTMYGQAGNAALNVGQNYANMATDPNAIAAYMNPYVQQSLAPQLAMLNQQQALQGQGIAANAVGRGAFGGNREALAQGLNAQNFDLTRQAAIGQGYNNAFNAATQAQQYGANLGLQGLNTANQAAQGLTQAGSAQNQANLGILSAQNQLGQQQYNLPYQNLQFLQGMMSGLPYSNQQTQGWQAPPNALSQMAGIGTTLLGGYGILNKAGLIPSLGGGGNNQYAAANQTMSDVNTGKIAPDAGATTSGGPLPGQTTDLSQMIDQGASGGLPKDFKKVKQYASGGLVSLALAKALKG